MLIDSVRHFLPLRVVKKIIDSLTFAKFNALHWHLSDNEAMVLQTKSAPRFWDSAYTPYERYTQSEMRDVVEYARQRGVRVIPEIDVPGHMKSWCTVCRRPAGTDAQTRRCVRRWSVRNRSTRRTRTRSR